MGTRNLKMMEEAIRGFESADAKFEIKVTSTRKLDKTDSSTVDEKVSEMMNNLRAKVESNGGFPFRYSKVVVENGYKTEGRITFNETTEAGKLLNDSIVVKLLLNGCATWKQGGEAGILFTEKFSTVKLRELNITVNEILNHPLFKMFYTSTGTKAKRDYTRVLLSRNSSNISY